MVVEDELDRRVGGVSGIEEFEKFNEFAAAVALPDEGVDAASERIDPGYQGQGVVAFVFVITHHGQAGCQAAADDPARSCRSPEYRAFRHRR